MWIKIIMRFAVLLSQIWSVYFATFIDILFVLNLIISHSRTLELDHIENGSDSALWYVRKPSHDRLLPSHLSSSNQQLIRHKPWELGKTVLDPRYANNYQYEPIGFETMTKHKAESKSKNRIELPEHMRQRTPVGRSKQPRQSPTHSRYSQRRKLPPVRPSIDQSSHLEEKWKTHGEKRSREFKPILQSGRRRRLMGFEALGHGRSLVARLPKVVAPNGGVMFNDEARPMRRVDRVSDKNDDDDEWKLLTKFEPLIDPVRWSSVSRTQKKRRSISQAEFKHRHDILREDMNFKYTACRPQTLPIHTASLIPVNQYRVLPRGFFVNRCLPVSTSTSSMSHASRFLHPTERHHPIASNHDDADNDSLVLDVQLLSSLAFTMQLSVRDWFRCQHQDDECLPMKTSMKVVPTNVGC